MAALSEKRGGQPYSTPVGRTIADGAIKSVDDVAETYVPD